MTLQCLEPYATEEEISAIIDRGVEFLADAQAEDGGYEAYGDKSSESVSQVILALSTYGIDCNKDARFRKKEKGLYDNLMEYYKKDGSFFPSIRRGQRSHGYRPGVLCNGGIQPVFKLQNQFL